MKHEKMPINIYSIITIILSAALLIGVIVWQFGGQDAPDPTEPSGSSGQPTGTQPSGNETNPSENSDPTGNVTDPTENGKPTEPKPTVPEPTEPEPTEPQPTEPKPTEPKPTEPEPTVKPTEPEPTEPKPTEPKPTEPEPTEPQPTEPKPTEPKPTEPKPTEPKPTEPKPTVPEPTVKPTEPEPTEPKPTEPKVGIKEVNETVYATSTVNVRSGPGTSYEKLGQLAKGDKLTRTGICDNGWSRVVYNGKVAYVSSSYLTTTNPNSNTGGNTPGNTSGNTGGNTSSGNSDGNTSGYTVGSYVGPNVGRTESGEIIYTYTDGTTGTVPKNGATYVDFRGIVRVYSDALEQAQEKYPPNDEPTRCSDCGKVLGDGTNGTCLRYLMNGHDCHNCGEYVPARTCHSCDED